MSRSRWVVALTFGALPLAAILPSGQTARQSGQTRVASGQTPRQSGQALLAFLT